MIHLSKKKSKSGEAKSSQEFFKEQDDKKENNLRVFSLSEIETATDNFKHLIRRGEYGSAYKGTIRPPNGEGDPVVVAITRLTYPQGPREWLDKVKFLGFLHHPNLVKLLGYYSVDTKSIDWIWRILVYEYMPNRSLEYHLFSRTLATLPWKARLEIILGAAQGLAYLHKTQVIYRTFKPSNVLLDDCFKPKLSDSWLAKKGPFDKAKKGPADEYDHMVAYKREYTAPEYTGHLTVESDIYNFGTVLYEILTGKKLWETNVPLKETFVVSWLKRHPADSKDFSMIIDPRLENQDSLCVASKIAKLADACMEESPMNRPRMSEVVEILKQVIEESVEGSYETSASSNLVASSKHRMEVHRSVFRSVMESILECKSKLGPYLHGKQEGSKCIVSTNESEILYGMGDTAEEGPSLSHYGNLGVSIEELVLLNEVREVVIRGLKLFPEDKDFVTRITEKVPLSYEKGVFEELLLIAKELEQTPLDPRELEELNYDPIEVPPLFSYRFRILHVLDLSYTSINSLPQSIFRLIELKKLILRGCELLMELPAELGELTNLEVLDLEGTEILSLPKEIGKLVNLMCLKVSFYRFGKQAKNLGLVFSKLYRLKELIVDANLDEESWNVEVRDIIDVLQRLQELRTIKLDLPTTKLLEDLTRTNPRSIGSTSSKFRFTDGPFEEHFISRLPCDVEDEFNNMEKFKKGLKFVNGEGIPIEFTKVLKHANAFFLQRHWTAKSLSDFGHENMDEVKFCLVMECNEFRTIIDYEQSSFGGEISKEYSSGDSEDFGDYDEAILLGSLEKLIIRYMKNMESICKGPVVYKCLSNLKSLALHTCPNLTTLFTIDMLGNLVNLEELIVEDCPKINNLVILKSSDSKLGLFLPKLKKISLLELPELVSISSGLCIAPILERMVIFYCPKLEKLAAMEVSSTNFKVIKGEKEWWDALKWYESDLSTKHEDHLATLFVQLRRDGNLMAQITGD